jgi:Ca2+-binding EF-hand superfamily protein
MRISPVREPYPVRVSPVREPLPLPVRGSPVKPLLHPVEEDALVGALRDLIVQERELESAKVALTMKADFNLHDAFVIFDHLRHGFITQADLREGLAAVGVFPSADEVALFFQRYDANRNHRLNFSEFSAAFLSDDNYYSHMLNRRPSNHRQHLVRRDDCFFPDTQAEQRNMWRVHFKVEMAAEAVRQRLAAHPYFHPVEAFNSLDLNSDGRITKEEIKRIIESRGFYVTHKEAD